MAKKRRSSQFKDTSQVIDIEEARKKRQEKRNKQHRQAASQQEGKSRTVRASIKAGRRKRKALYAVIIVLIIAAIGMSVLNIISLKAEQKEAKAEQERLLDEKKQLEQQLEESSTPAYIEDAARETLRMINPGETIYVIPYEKNNVSDQNKDKTDKERE